MTKFLLKQKYVFIAVCMILIILASVFFIIGEGQFNLNENDLKTFILNDEQIDTKQNEDTYRKVIDNETDEFLIMETDVMIKYISPKWLDEMGYDEKDIDNENFFTLVHPEDLPFIANSMIVVIDYKTVKDNIGPFRLKNKNDEYKLYMGQAVPIFNNQGKIVLIGFILHDLSNPLGGTDEEKDLSDYDHKELENLITMAK